MAAAQRADARLAAGHARGSVRGGGDAFQSARWAQRQGPLLEEEFPAGAARHTPLFLPIGVTPGPLGGALGSA